MRRRPVLVALAVLATAVVGPALPAHAADTSVVSSGGLPANVTVTGLDVTNATVPTAFSWVTGPTGVPTGLGSLQLNQSTDEITGVVTKTGPWALPDLTAAAAVARSSAEYQLVAHVTDGVTEHLVVARGVGDGTWTSVDLLTSNVDVFTPALDPVTSTTWLLYAAAHPTATVDSIDVWFSYAGAAPSWIDTIRTGTAAGVEMLDFDVAHPLVLTSVAAPATVVGGSTTTVSGSVALESGDPVPDLTIELWGRAYGAADYAKLTTTTSGADGTFSVQVRPTSRTAYQWRTSDPAYVPATSVSRTVSVQDRLTLNVLDASLARGQILVAWGTTYPTIRGTKVSLKRAGSATALATAVVRADGTFAFARALPTGTYSVFVTSPAAGGLSAGASAKVKVVAK